MKWIVNLNGGISDENTRKFGELLNEGEGGFCAARQIDFVEHENRRSLDERGVVQLQFLHSN